jgi:hypothetical protein
MKEIGMSVSVSHSDRPSHRWTWPLALHPARVAAALKFVREVFVEARALARQASRQHPYSE